ncbi:hypothetical protein O3Q52_01590 [Streptomyces sp. ActVer]|uniref:hypothetical protein n=1 Tax=Streptomyces sp. ActVer TaxID=3014558 RepID=UPI0022B2B56F|nr:hypothetical protein [Streptomyces sp. ActVer]MCZ4506920.1 hypothetical protein [Streptomyces sp. ActVer]
MPYATVSELEAWLAPEPAPENAVRLLTRASTAIDRALYGLAYDKTDAAVKQTLSDACVQQVQWLIDRDDETGAQNDLQSMTTGQRSFTRRTVGQGAGATPRIADSVADVLLTSGHFQGFVWTWD